MFGCRSISTSGPSLVAPSERRTSTAPWSKVDTPRHIAAILMTVLRPRASQRPPSVGCGQVPSRRRATTASSIVRLIRLAALGRPHEHRLDHRIGQLDRNAGSRVIRTVRGSGSITCPACLTTTGPAPNNSSALKPKHEPRGIEGRSSKTKLAVGRVDGRGPPGLHAGSA